MRAPTSPLGCLVVACLAFAVAGCGRSGYEPGEELAGGATTVFDESRNAFGLSARNLPFERRSAFFVGNSFFNQNWVTAPASTTSRDGLGPFFNTRSCSSCHLRDGRGRPPEPGDEALGGADAPSALVLRLSVPGTDPHGGPAPEPTYGLVLSPLALPGLEPEGTVAVSYEDVPGTFADGTPYTLRRPAYSVTETRYGPLADSVRLSPRVAPVVFGAGLLEAVPAHAVRALADPDDADGDGISGRPNEVWSVLHQKPMLGRFGLKANEPTVADQVAAAFAGDMGITTSLHPENDCSAAGDPCRQLPHGGAPELIDPHFEQVVFYTKTLAVPARRGADDPVVLRGKRLFHEAQCAACHVPRLHTGTVEAFPELSNQTIYPYTDLLLHDMGDALADGRPDFEADGREWRTPPLWGIGLVETVNGHTTFLHDGRARNLMEALLWHGGEAEQARQHVLRMTAAERDALITFLESL